MEIRQLKTFITIVKLGSFSQAAQFLGYTQSTVTTHIQLLEKELATALFERFGHQLMLTTDGERLYDYAEQIAKLADDAKNEFDNFAVPRGPVIIGMPESLCVYYLTDVLKEYASLYPDVGLKLKLGIASDFRLLLRKNMMDLAFFLEKNIKDADLVGQLLWPEPVVMVAAPQHRLARQKKVRVKDLQGQTFVFTDAGSSYRRVLEEILAKTDVQARTVLEIGQIQTIKQFVIANLGIAILPLIAVKKEIETGLLAALPWQGPDLKTGAYLVYHKDKWHSHAIRAFIKLVQERLLK
ncbi:LysR family transcriptional regulator [Sporomusa termitida]|uniref:HTH-type transcriptional regulator GltR n=1 Tax=Sporomusa termitida TaxID=2377 RepID=A0A517DYC3_9FIRM|nr:LysR family transcriptional regulator [Sporomusa termitida]QDR82348.1 HTH-type transcriptional regulator GltR [Sporomusa termitida]